jgi:hypothetical protein
MKSFTIIMTTIVTAIAMSVVPSIVNLPPAKSQASTNFKSIALQPTPKQPLLDANGSTQVSRIVRQIAQTQRQRRSNGQIRAVYRDSQNEIAQIVLQIYRKERFFERISEIITSKIQLPRQVTVYMQDCGTPNAFYQSQNHSITICNELTTSLISTFIKSGVKTEEAAELTVYTIMFVFYHEAGHMLVNELDLPITGREEDVADQFSAYILLDWFNVDPETAAFGQQVVESASRWFAISKSNLGDLNTFMDEHSLNEQRFLSLLCMLYIKNPDQYAGLVGKLGFTPNRLRGCRAESAQIARSWNVLLKPHAKELRRENRDTSGF